MPRPRGSSAKPCKKGEQFPNRHESRRWRSAVHGPDPKIVSALPASRVRSASVLRARPTMCSCTAGGSRRWDSTWSCCSGTIS